MNKLPKNDPTIEKNLKEAETDQEYITLLIENYLANRTQKINVKYERMNEYGRVPTRVHWNDAAYDLWAYDMEAKPDGRLMYKTGIKMAIPDNYVGLVFPRSSTSKRNLILGNCVAVFDAGYRGEILIPYKTLHYRSELMDVDQSTVVPTPWINQVDPNAPAGVAPLVVGKVDRYEVSPEQPERIAQILFIPRTDVNWEEVDYVDESTRGEGNFGHTGQGTEIEREVDYVVNKKAYNGWIDEKNKTALKDVLFIQRDLEENA